MGASNKKLPNKATKPMWYFASSIPFWRFAEFFENVADGVQGRRARWKRDKKTRENEYKSPIQLNIP